MIYSSIPFVAICTPVNPCRNSGVCKISGDSYTCVCPDGFGGPQCQYIGKYFREGCNIWRFLYIYVPRRFWWEN